MQRTYSMNWPGISIFVLFGVLPGTTGNAAPLEPGVDLFIPAVAESAGLSGSNFASTLWLMNPNSVTAYLQLRFHEVNTSSTNPVSVEDLLAPGESKRYDHVLAFKFGRQGTSGALRIISTLPIYASSRTYDLAPGGAMKDSKGMFLEGVPTGRAITLGQNTVLQGVSQGAAEDFRYNFGLVEALGSSCVVRVALHAATGGPMGYKEYSIPAYGRVQFSVTDVVASIVTTNAIVVASVVGGAGGIILYGTQIANGSNDASGFEMGFAPFVGSSAGSDKCGADSPGVKFSMAGKSFVIVESEVVLEGSGRSFIVRYPVPYPITGVSPRFILRRACYSFGPDCYFGGKTGSICGNVAALSSSSRLSRTMYLPIGSTGWVLRHMIMVRAEVKILLDSQYEPLVLSADGGSTIDQSVSDVALYGYSFVVANFPPPPVDLVALEVQMAAFFDRISVRPR